MAIFENSPKLKSPVTFKTEPTNKNKPTTNNELKIWKSDYTKYPKFADCDEDPKKIPGVLKLAPVLNHVHVHTDWNQLPKWHHDRAMSVVLQ